MRIFNFLFILSFARSECDYVTAVPTSVRSHYRLSSFYQKYISAFGIPVLGSNRVSDKALKRACYVLRFLMSDREDIRTQMRNRNGRVAIMATNEVTTNIPEHAHLGAFWNTRARGLGGTPQIPVSTGAEENVLCLRSDRYREDIFLHEFSHGIHLIAANYAIPNFDYRLNSLYRQVKN